jgi:hypothetical protein
VHAVAGGAAPAADVPSSSSERQALRGWHNGRYYDDRLTKIAHRYRPPLCVWACWVYSHPYFQTYIISLVVLSSVVLAVQVEVPEENYVAHRIMERIDLFILFCFITEMSLKWLDSFTDYWKDTWNIFDFILTCLAVRPPFFPTMPCDPSLAHVVL